MEIRMKFPYLVNELRFLKRWKLALFFRGGGKFTGYKNEMPMHLSKESSFGLPPWSDFSFDFLVRKHFF